MAPSKKIIISTRELATKSFPIPPWRLFKLWHELCTVKWKATEGCTSHCGIVWSFLGEVAYQRPHRWCISLISCHLDPILSLRILSESGVPIHPRCVDWLHSTFWWTLQVQMLFSCELLSCYGEDGEHIEWMRHLDSICFFSGKPSMGLVIYACHFAAVGFCGTLEERLASLSGKTYCSMINPTKKMFFIRAQRGRESNWSNVCHCDFLKTDIARLMSLDPLDEFDAFSRSWADVHGFHRATLRQEQ